MRVELWDARYREWNVGSLERALMIDSNECRELPMERQSLLPSTDTRMTANRQPIIIIIFDVNIFTLSTSCSDVSFGLSYFREGMRFQISTTKSLRNRFTLELVQNLTYKIYRPKGKLLICISKIILTSQISRRFLHRDLNFGKLEKFKITFPKM